MKQPLFILFHSRPLAFISGLVSVSATAERLQVAVNPRKYAPGRVFQVLLYVQLGIIISHDHDHLQDSR